jgi:hypothetical protein
MVGASALSLAVSRSAAVKAEAIGDAAAAEPAAALG